MKPTEQFIKDLSGLLKKHSKETGIYIETINISYLDISGLSEIQPKYIQQKIDLLMKKTENIPI
jgi:hypothetical protein